MKQQLVLEGMEIYRLNQLLAAVGYEQSNEEVTRRAVELYNEIYGTDIPTVRS